MKLDHRASTCLALVLILAGGIFFRFCNLDRIILFGDEPLHQVRISHQSFSYAYQYNDGSPFFTLLVHFLLPLGKIELMARLASAFFGVLALWMAYILGKSILGKRDALGAAAFLAFSPFHIFFSMYSRAYGVGSFLALLSLYSFFRAMRNGKRRDWLLYALTAVLLLFNHVLTLFILPAYGLMAAALWLEKGGISKESRASGWRLLLRSPLGSFALWTGLAVAAAAMLYVPDKVTRAFVFQTAQRTRMPVPEAPLSLGLAIDILRRQLHPSGDAVFAFALFVFLAGFARLLVRRPGLGLSLFLYLSIPFGIFVVIRPDDVTVLSADRYFIFALPIIFLCMSSGIALLASGLMLLLKKIRGRHQVLFPAKGAAASQLVLILLFLVIAHGPGLKKYYLDNWRLSSCSLDRDVENCLRRNLKRDALIYVDAFPASRQILVASPLGPDFRDTIINHSYEARDPENDYMIYKIGKIHLEWFIHTDTELWAVSRLDADARRILAGKAREFPSLAVFNLENDVVLHFKKDGTPLSEKLRRLAAIFLSVPLDPAREKEFRFLAARAHFHQDGFDPGLEELKRAQSVRLRPPDARIPGSTRVDRFLDRIFGLTDPGLRDTMESRFNSDIGLLLFRFGNGFIPQNKDREALRAYSECLALTKDHNPRVAAKLGILAGRALLQGKLTQSIELYREALTLDPELYEIRFALAELLRNNGRAHPAEAEYRRVFGVDSLPPGLMKRIWGDAPFAVIWKKGRTWLVLFRSTPEARLSGRILSSGAVQALTPVFFDQGDLLRQDGNEVTLEMRTEGGLFKAANFSVPRNAFLKFDLSLDCGKSPGQILFLE